MKLFLSIIFALFLTGCATSNTLIVRDEDSNKNYKIHLNVDETKSKETVLIMHGCNGVSPHTFSWSEQVVKWGYNAVVFDSFYTYGHSNLCAKGKENYFHSMRAAVDSRYLGEWIKKQSWSNGKVSFIGFSMGAVTGVSLATSNAHAEYDTVFNSVVSFYPTCPKYFSTRIVTTPFLVLTGEKDNWIILEDCKAMAESKRKDLEMHFYPNAEHGWDIGTSGTSLCWLGTCTWGYNRSADVQSREVTREFLDRNFKK